MTHVIEAVGLTKSYGKRRGIVDVEFAVKEGEAGLNIWLNHPIPATLETEELRLE